MRVLFLDKRESFMAPVGLLQIAAIADLLGHEVGYADINDPDFLKYLKVFEPHVVAASIMTGEAKHYYQVAETIAEQRPEALMVAGGMHPTFFPEMVKESKWHIACRGEGEMAFKNLLMDMEAGTFPVDKVQDLMKPCSVPIVR